MATWKEITKSKLTQSDWSLILANLVPVIGVWFYKWQAKEVFMVYCMETVIIGAFTVLKLIITGTLKKNDVWNNGDAVSKQHYLVFVFFFIFHYGFFVAIQTGLFFAVSGIGQENSLGLFNFFSKSPSLITKDMAIMLAIFITGYGFRMTRDYIMTGEYRTASLNYIMFAPYGRIFIQQFTVILGSIFLSYGAGKMFILIFALAKIFFEVFIDLEGLIKKTAQSKLQ